jgi:hypothetical protein
LIQTNLADELLSPFSFKETMLNPRTDLERLPSANLFDIGRNPAALHRKLAIEILVERASPLVGREEIAEEAREFILNNPVVIKTIDPAAAWLAPNLPNIVDCLAHEMTQREELSRIVGEHHAVHTDNHVAHTQKTAALEATVNKHEAANVLAIAEVRAVLWRDYTGKIFQLKLDYDSELAELRAEHEKDITAATKRLTLLERSLWQKFMDFLKSVKSKGIARPESPVSDPPAST